MRRETMIDRIYVINLERRPDRLAHFMKECAREGVPPEKIQVWKAVDGQSHRFTEEELALFRASDLALDTDTGRGCMGNQLSHLQILQDILLHGHRHCLIFQDDVKLGPSFWSNVQCVASEMKEMNAPFVWIGLHQLAIGSYFEEFDLDRNDRQTYLHGEPLTEHIGRLQPHVNPASLAYLVSQDGASSYVKHLQQHPIQFATDKNYRAYLLEQDAFFTSVPVLCTGNASFRSDIFLYDDHAVTRDLLDALEEMMGPEE